VNVFKSISLIHESPVVIRAFQLRINLISVTFLPVAKIPERFLTLMVSICINLFVDVSNTQQDPFRVPTTSHSPSREKLIDVI